MTVYVIIHTTVDDTETHHREIVPKIMRAVARHAIWPWVSRYEWQTVDLKAYPNVKRWYISIASRPAVLRGYNVPKDVGGIPMPA